jgi:DNA-binding SARP family transcriptional activator
VVGIDFGVLGPFSAQPDDGSPIQLGALKPFRVLGLLLLQPGQSFSADWMITEVWGPDTDPRSGHDSLKSAIAQLNRWFRAHAEGPRIQHRRPDGYVLDATVGVDSLRFVELVGPHPADADPRSRRERLVGALALWRGTRAWPGFEDVPSLATEAVRLEELRLAALHSRIDIDLQLGQHRAVIAELEALLQHRPDHEDFCAELMLALYRSGRQRDALEAFSRTARALRDDLGLEPGPALRQLERAILVQDPELDLVRPTGDRSGRPPVAPTPPPLASGPAAGPAVPEPFVAASLPAPSGSIVGREEILSRLAAVRRPDAGRSDQLVSVSGPAGVGKTRLLVELASLARGEGTVVLHGWSDSELDLPYQPIVELLRAWVSAAALDDLRAAVGPHGPDLARLVPDIGTRLDLPTGPTGAEDGDAARYRLFDSLWNLFAVVGSTGSVVLVLIDDMHWADFGTCQLLRYLVRRGLPDSMRLVLAGREDEMADQPGGRLLSDVGAGLTGRRERLRLLAEPETVALVRQLAPAAWGTVNWVLGRRIHQLTAGLPFAVRAIVDASPRAAPAEELVDAALDVQVALTRRITLLPPPTRELLRLAAIHGPTFDAGELAELAERPVDDVVGDLEAAREAGVIVDLPALPDVYRFDHELSRRALERDLTVGRRARIQARLAEQAEARGASPVEVARRRCAAVPVVPAVRAFEEAAAAGQVALEGARFEEAARFFEAAVSLADDHPGSGIDELDVTRALVALVRALDYEGDATRALAVSRRAMAGARRLGSAEWMARAALALDVHRGPTVGDAGHLDLLEEAEAAVGDDVDVRLRAQLTLERLWAATTLGRAHVDLAALDAVAETAAQLGAADLAFQVAALRCAARVDPTGRSWPANLALMERTAEQLDDPRGTAVACSAGFVVHLTLGDPEAAERALERQEQANASFAQPWHQWNAPKQRVCLLLARGRFDEARASMDDVLHLGDRYEIADAWAAFAVQLYVWSWHQGGVAPLVEALAGMVSAQPSSPAWRAALGWAQLARGDRDGATAELAMTVSALNGNAPDPFRRIGLAVAVELAAHLDRPDGVAPLVADLGASSGQLLVIAAGVATLGPVDRYRGLGAALLGRRAEGLRLLHRAAKQADRLGLLPWAVMARADLVGLGGLPAAEVPELAGQARALGMADISDRLDGLAGG